MFLLPQAVHLPTPREILPAGSLPNDRLESRPHETAPRSPHPTSNAYSAILRRWCSSTACNTAGIRV
jgi:hypothetical protein